MTPLAERNARSLWRHFFVLTEEMDKFLRQNDIDDFIEMQRQRNIFYERIRGLAGDDYRDSDEWRQQVERYRPLESAMMAAARAWLNKSRTQNARIRSYDPTERPLRPGNLVSVKS